MMKTHSNNFFKLFSAGLISLSTIFAGGTEFFLDYASMACGPVPVATTDPNPEMSQSVLDNDGLLRSFTAAPTRVSKGGAAFSVGDFVTIKFFNDVEFVVEIIKMRSDIFGVTYIGAVDGIACVTLIDSPEGLCIDAQNLENGRVYGVTSTAVGASVKESVILPTKDLPSIVPDADALAGTVVDTDGKGVIVDPNHTDCDSATCLIDVMIAYEKGASVYASANGGITNFARRAVAKLNTAIANTDLDQYFNFRLVGVEVVDEVVTELDSALELAQRGTGSDWRWLRKRREACGADIVSVMIDTGSAYGTVGLGYALDEKNSVTAFGALAFNTCSIRSVAQSHTMTHEIGHNLGAGHSNAQADAPGPQWSLNTKPYSSGYYFDGPGAEKYGTVMAYNSDGYGGRYTILPIFSSPNHKYNGVVVGTTKNNDNTRVIKETYRAASQWTEQVLPLTYGLDFSVASGSVFNESLTVILTPEVDGQSIYYTLDGKMPSLDSILYTEPIVITETTTIKAVTYNGNDLSPVFEATYYKNDIKEALDAPELEWDTGNYDWQYTVNDTFDGEDAAKIVIPAGRGASVEISTTVTGPTEMDFNYKTLSVYNEITLEVYLDEDIYPIFTSTNMEDAYNPNSNWRLAIANIPEGGHRVTIRATANYSYEDPMVFLDNVRFDAISASPVILPESTESEYSAKIFTGSLDITMTAAEGSSIYYTLDGKMPSEASILYTGPFTISNSVWVTAIAIQEGREASPTVRKMYLERHPLDYGEWTTDFQQVFDLALNETNDHILITATEVGKTQSDFFRDVIFDPAFLSWAKANKYYLLITDGGLFPDYKQLQDQYSQIEPQEEDEVPLFTISGLNIPAMLVCDHEKTPLAHLKNLIRLKTFEVGPTNAPEKIVYQGTVPSLVEIISKTWTRPLTMPTVSDNEEMQLGYPIELTLSHDNEEGEIYYSLDGTSPDMESILYGTNEVITITRPTTLQAEVWSSPTNSSPVLFRSYYTVNDLLKLPGDVSWTMNSFHSSKWGKAPNDPNAIRSGVFSDNGRSSIEATFTGKGKLTYTIEAVSNGSQNRAEVYLDKKRIYKKAYSDVDGNTYFTDEMTHEFTDDGPHVVRWVFELGYVYAYNGDYIQISSIKWEPERAYTATPVPVPYDWIKERNPGVTTSEEIELAATLDEDDDGYVLWEEYLAGSNPYDGNSYFYATIKLVDGEPVVGWNIDNGENADYTVLGSDDPMGPFVEPVLSTHRFFKVRIKPKAQE